jgi:hypothetical protein
MFKIFPQKYHLAKLLLQKDGPSLACECIGLTLVITHHGQVWTTSVMFGGAPV